MLFKTNKLLKIEDTHEKKMYNFRARIKKERIEDH